MWLSSVLWLMSDKCAISPKNIAFQNGCEMSQRVKSWIWTCRRGLEAIKEDFASFLYFLLLLLVVSSPQIVQAQQHSNYTSSYFASEHPYGLYYSQPYYHSKGKGVAIFSHFIRIIKVLRISQQLFSFSKCPWRDSQDRQKYRAMRHYLKFQFL